MAGASADNRNDDYSLSSVVRRAKYLRLAAVNVSDGMRSGAFRSMFRARGIEFAGVREYLQGDDVRSIDWNVTSRMGKPFVKMFDEERELTVFLVVDRSLSMRTGAAARSRLSQASEAAALLAFAAEQNASPLGAVFFHGEITFTVAPKPGRDQVMTVLKHLDGEDSRVPGSVLANALAGAGQLLRSRSLVIVISDFRSAGYENRLARLALRHDVVAVRITDPADEQLPSSGYVPFFDPESGEHISLPTGSRAFRRSWQQSGREHAERWMLLCLRRGAYPLELSTKDDAAAVLTRFFSSREQR